MADEFLSDHRPLVIIVGGCFGGLCTAWCAFFDISKTKLKKAKMLTQL